METIKSHRDFERVYTCGRRYNHPLMRMTVCDVRNEGDPGRVAFVAAKRLGCAVVRNRSKRVLRATVQGGQFPVAGKDVIFFATPKTRSASPAEMHAALRSLCKRAGLPLSGGAPRA